MKKVLFVFLSLLLSQSCFSQYYAVGEDPNSVKFDYLETPHFKVVFPQPLYDYALQLAAMLEQSYSNTQFDKKIITKRIQVLIHTKNSISNGFVSWAPKRMELMAIPPHNFEAMSWSRELAIHEFRHVSQISTLYKGLTGLSYYVLGEQGIGLMTSLVPLWFYEGDAVASETAYTQSGRGRNADFNLEYRVRMAEGIDLKFDQYLNGSYKIPIPDHYHLGYHMVSYARAVYGDDIWNKVTRYTTNYPFLLAPFSFGIKKYTNNTREQLFKKSLTFYDSCWSKLSNNRSKNTINKTIRNYIDYLYPLKIGSSIYSFKNTLSKNPQLVRILSSGKEEELKTIGSIDSSPFSDGENIYWTEYMYAGRWAQVRYSVIRKYSIINNSYSTLSDHKYYSYPTLKGDSLAILQNLPDNKLSIGLYSKDFKHLNEYPIPYEQAKDLQWVANNIAYVTLDNHDNMMVVQQNLSSNKIDTLLNFDRKNMSCVKVSRDSITFISDYSGKSCLYSFNISTKAFSKLYEPNYGISSYSILSPSRIIASEYNLNGYKLAEHFIDPTPLQRDEISRPNYPVADLLSKNVGVNLQDSVLSVPDFKVHKYNKFTHLFNFHSWAPFYFDPTEVQELNLNIHPGFTLVSQNLLSTSFTTLGYGYTPEGHIINVSQTFRGWAPVLNLQFDRYNTSPISYKVNNHPYTPDSSLHRYKLALSSYLPLQFSYGAWSALVQPFIEYSHYNDLLYNSSTAKYEEGLDEVTTSFYGALQMKLAHQNIFPRWGVNFYFKTTSAPFEDGNLGRLYAYRLGIITPGLFRNHGFMTRLCYQNQEVDRYYYSNAFILPRGYNYSYRSNYYKAVFNDYSLPIAYPDFNLSWLVYLKRIRLNLFADFAENTSMYYVKDKSNKIIGKIYPETYYSSTGMDLLFDLNLLRSTFPITAGARVSYNNDGTTTWNSVFSINFN